jgi:integrase/recombinase XerC
MICPLSECVGEGALRRVDLAGAAHLEMVSGVVQLRPEDAITEAMLRGWRAQQAARGLKEDTIIPRERLVRHFLDFTNEYPWRWMPSHVDEWSLSTITERRLAPSTIRGYQTDLRLFTEFLADNVRYGWVSACESEFGPDVYPVPIVHEWNSIAHLNSYEGNPEARPFTREELQRFVDYADDQVDRAVKAKRKGAMAAYRDATLFKVIYGWGLRRTETSKLDVVDWDRNPQAPQFGRFGMLHVRYGKAKRGQPPRRRNVASVMDWAVDAVADYVENIRPRFGCADHPALWVTERGGRGRTRRPRLRPRRLTGNAGLRLVREHRTRRRHRHPLLPHAHPPKRRNRTASRGRTDHRHRRVKRPLQRPTPALRGPPQRRPRIGVGDRPRAVHAAKRSTAGRTRRPLGGHLPVIGPAPPLPDTGNSGLNPRPRTIRQLTPRSAYHSVINCYFSADRSPADSLASFH